MTPSPAKPRAKTSRRTRSMSRVIIPRDEKSAVLQFAGEDVRLTNLDKVFWPREGITKRDLLQYYANIAHVLLPHLQNRAMVMRRYPDGAFGPSFFMKRTPEPKPAWLSTCAIPHPRAGIVNYPIIHSLAALLWCVNLGCIDLNPWYATCDDYDRPWLMVFDLDPVKAPRPTPFRKVLEAALVIRDALQDLGVVSYPKSSGSRGIHIYVPIKRDLKSGEITAIGKRLSLALARARPNLLTAEYRIAKRPAGRVLVDHNQNAWGRTLASVYSVRPRPHAPVSAPLTWKEIEQGITIDEFRLDNMARRIARSGDLFEPLLGRSNRSNLAKIGEGLGTTST